jgi:integrase
LCRVRHKHDLRHSYATVALAAGISPKVISEQISHANVGFFLQTYAHILRNDDRDAAERAASFPARHRADRAKAEHQQRSGAIPAP